MRKSRNCRALSGVLPNRMAFEAVKRELKTTVIIEGHEPLIGPFDFSLIVGHPTTKWSGKPVYVVHDHGACQFGVAYTSDPGSMDQIPMSVMDMDIMADMLAYERMRLNDMTDGDIRNEMYGLHQQQKYCSEQNLAQNQNEIQKLRNVLRRRHHLRKQAAQPVAA